MHLLPVLVVLVVTGCTSTDQPPDRTDDPSAVRSLEPTPRPGTDEAPPPEEAPEPDEPPPPEEAPDARPEPAHPVSVQALIETGYDGRGLRVGDVLGEFGEYTRYAVTYRSQGLRISGIMNVPAGRGPFPVLVLNHGYIDPAIYVTGQGLAREQDWLARQGYVVLHTDYRNHAGSDDDPDVSYQLWLPYAVDVINAVEAVKRSDLPYLDGERVGLLGRSMGGSVTLNALVARPGLVDAAVVYATTSSLAAENWRQFYEPNASRAADSARMERTYGLPRQSPAFWRAASPGPDLDRITEPLLLHHGTLDDTCPIGWSRDILQGMQAAGQQARLIEYEGEGHTMYAQWQRSIEATTAFFDRHLR